ncbi:MAG: hypothetical protein AMXMBFR64_43830 [Myxococcales bacterium]
MNISGLEPFVAVAETRSFRGAAARLGVSAAAISKAVQRLEDELGVRLFLRTTRHVSLTPEGEVLHAHAREALDRLAAGLDEVARARGLAEGPLRISLSPVLGRVIVAALPRLLQRHPRLVPDLSMTDRVVSLAEGEVDVAVRIGALPDSSLVAHRLRAPRWVTVASPAYLARRGTPAEPGELASHACLKYAPPRGGTVEWTFRVREQPVEVRTPTALRVDDGDALVTAALAGLGVAQVFGFMVADALADGRLVEVLAPYAAPGPPLTALMLPGRQDLPRVKAFLEFLDDLGRGGPSLHTPHLRPPLTMRIE